MPDIVPAPEAQRTATMNRAFLIVLIPSMLVALGYIVVLRMMGVPPGYGRLGVFILLFFGLILWLSKRPDKKPKTNGS
jgi:uncharacterized membrane protein